MGDYPALPVQIDNDTVIPFYSWLAKQHTFCDHHFGVGSNSTSGHMLAIGGQAPTLKNPPFFGPNPIWDIPTIFTVAEAGGLSWAAFPDGGGHPTKFYANVNTAAGAANVLPPSQFIPMAEAETLPQVCYVWAPAGFDEHPPHTNDPAYVAKGHDLVWQRVQAVIDGGGWPNTTFILSWDDWGGYADSVPTPVIETVADALHPGGFAAIGGSRIPLVMFGGKVTQGIDSAWHSHASIPKTIIDLLGLPAVGVPRVDQALSLAGLIDPLLSRPLPPPYGATITQPIAPPPTPVPVPPAPWAVRPRRCPRWSPWTAVSCQHPATGRAPPPAQAAGTNPDPSPKPTPTRAPAPGQGPLHDLVDKACAGKSAAGLAAARHDALKILSGKAAKALNTALGVTSIGGLARNRIILAAQTIRNAAVPANPERPLR